MVINCGNKSVIYKIVFMFQIRKGKTSYEFDANAYTRRHSHIIVLCYVQSGLKKKKCCFRPVKYEIINSNNKFLKFLTSSGA